MSKRFDPPGLHLSELAGYSEDKAAGSRFFRPYLLVTLPSIAVFVICLLAIVVSGFHWGFFAAAVTAILLLGLFLLYAPFLPRKHPFTKEKLSIFRNLSAPEGFEELLFVDEVNKTYFRHAHRSPPSRG